MGLNSIAPINNSTQLTPIITTPSAPIVAVTNVAEQNPQTTPSSLTEPTAWHDPYQNAAGTDAPAAGTGGGVKHLLRSARRRTSQQRVTTTVPSRNPQPSTEKVAATRRREPRNAEQKQENRKENHQKEKLEKAIFHSHSVLGAAKALNADPSIDVDVLMAATQRECLKLPQDENGARSQTLWQGQIINEATDAHGKIEKVNHLGLANVLGHVAQHQDCFQSVSVETAHLPKDQANIRQYFQKERQAQAVKDAEDIVLGRCTNDPSVEQTGVKPCHPKLRYKAPANPVHTEAQKACAGEVAIVSDGLFGEDIMPYISHVTTFNEPSVLANGDITRAHTTNVTAISDGTTDFNRASNYARAALRRCPQTRFHDVRATENVPSAPAQAQEGGVVRQRTQPHILTAQMLLQALDQILKLPDLPQNIVLLEPLELPDYHPDFYLLEQIVQALIKKGVRVSSFAGSEISWLHRIKGVETMTSVSDGLVPPPVPPLPVAEAVASSVSILGIAAILGCLGFGVCAKRRHNARRNAGMTEPLLPTQRQDVENEAFVDDNNESSSRRSEEALLDSQRRRRRNVNQPSQAETVEMQAMGSRKLLSEEDSE